MHPLPLTRAYRNRPKNPQKTILEKPQKLQDTVKRRPVGVIPLGGDRYREKPSSYSILKPNSPPKEANFPGTTELQREVGRTASAQTGCLSLVNSMSFEQGNRLTKRVITHVGA